MSVRTRGRRPVEMVERRASPPLDAPAAPSLPPAPSATRDTFTRGQTPAAILSPPGAARAGTPRGVSILDARRLATARDEAVDARGHVRPHYRSVLPLMRDRTKARLERAFRESKRAFGGDNALHPTPRLLTASEYERLATGVRQRATALRMFLDDHYSGKKTYASLIPPAVVDGIVARNREASFDGLVPNGHIAFPYGPDILRAGDGNFYVIEDNTGYIGGPGDLIKARETVFALTPELKRVLKPLDDPRAYFQKIVAQAKRHAIPADGRIVMYMVPPYPDAEDSRLKKIMKEAGVEIVTPNTKARLTVNEQGVFLRRAGEPLERVGYVFLNAEHRWVDASHPSTRASYVLSEAEGHLDNPKLAKTKRAKLKEAMAPDPKTGRTDPKKVERALGDTGLARAADIRGASSAKGLMGAILGGKVATNYSPGVDFVGDKAFKGYVDDLVRFYLKEEPLLPSIPVQKLAAPGVLKTLFAGEEWKKWVFKVVDGRGGTGVFIGPKMTPADAKALQARIAKDPARYVAEPFTPLSRLDGHIVDLRLIAAVTPDEVVVSPTPWGRGVPVDGDGKVNLSQKGKEFAVMVVEDPKPASQLASRSTRSPTRPSRGPRSARRATRRPDPSP